MSFTLIADDLAEARAVWSDPTRPAEERINALVAVMTRQEKIAQLGGYWADERTSDDVIAPMQDQMSAGRVSFEESVTEGLGQLTRVFGTRPVTAAQGIAELIAAQRVVVDANRLGIPAIAHEESLTGFTAYTATVYPTSLAWGATFDAELVEQMAEAIGSDLRRVGVHQTLSPVLDVTTDYRWGRVEETISEDPYVVATLATAYVRGIQAHGVIATLKHFAGHASSRGGRNHAPTSIGRRELADLVLPPFELAVREGGAKSVMNSYTEQDRVPAAADRWLLTELLRGEWGFDGTVVSDYWAVPFLLAKHRVAATVPEAARLALHAGIDVELPDLAAYRDLGLDDPDPLRTADDIDIAVRRVLRHKLELGLLDADWTPEDTEADVDLDSPRNRALARRLAEESIVLLDNGGAKGAAAALPLSSSVGSVALIGPGVTDGAAWMGAYSFPVHVLPRHPELGLGLPMTALPAALGEILTDTRIETSRGCGYAEVDESGIAAAVQLAERSEVAVVVVGDRAGMFGQGTSGEGSDSPSLDLPGSQTALVEALLNTSTPVVLVVLSGRPYALGAFVGRAAAIVQAFFPGVEGPAALARVLTGTVNPSGRLPVQVPATSGALPHTYLAPPLGQDGDGISNLSIAAAFPFGHGLSYTSYALGEMHLDRTTIGTTDEVVATVEVTNTGERRGTTVVQLYAEDPAAQVTRPVRYLVGYARVPLAAGERASVAFTVHAERFSFVGLAGHRIVEPGILHLSAGLSLSDRTADATVKINGPERAVVGARVLRTPVAITRAQ